MSYHTYQTIAILFKVCIVGFTRKACYAMMKYLRSVRYAKFEVCIGGRPPSASFHRAHRSHNGGDIVMLRLAEIQIPNSVLCATTIFLSFFKTFLVSYPWLEWSESKATAVSFCLKNLSLETLHIFTMCLNQSAQNNFFCLSSFEFLPHCMRSLGEDLEIKAGRSQSLDSLIWCLTRSYFKAGHGNKYQTQSF